MSKHNHPQQQQSKGTAAAQAAKSEEDAVVAAAEAAAAEAAKSEPVVVSSAPPPPPKLVGTVTVSCLKTEPFVRLGGTTYSLTKGSEIQMDISHAQELEQTGWVVVRGKR